MKVYFLTQVYLLMLIMPYVSPVSFALSGLLFLYYWVAVLVFLKNKCKLGKHEFTEKMVPASQAPPFSG